MRTRLLVVALSLAVAFPLAAPSAAQAKHPFTFEDMMKLKRVGEPVPSPDGRWVLFSLLKVNRGANTGKRHTWPAPPDPARAAPRHLPTDPAAKNRPPWP